MTTDFQLDNIVVNNFKNVKLWLLIPPFFLLFLFFIYFSLSEGANFVDVYIESQKDLFHLINGKLSLYPNVFYNITQLGDALIIFSFVIVLLYMAPKFWEVLLTSSILTLIMSAVLKSFFKVPRPAAVFDADGFIIVGKTLYGNTSLPSGHSMTIFLVVTLLLYAFMPKRNNYKVLWSFIMVALGLIIAFSRVGVGAHYPFDVIIGSTIGYIVAITGIILNNNLRWLGWIRNKKFIPIIILLISIHVFLIIKKITEYNLIIYYLSLLSLIVSLFFITKIYVKKN